MFSFSACIPRIFGTVTKVGGGVGGTSPVIRTRASIPAQSSLRAVTGVSVKTSMLFGDGGEASESSPLADMASPLSEEGFGGGGGGRQKVSAESWMTDALCIWAKVGALVYLGGEE